jgi:hypothetical protein
LYDENLFNDIKIYNNSRFKKCFFTFSYESTCTGNKVDFDRLNAWHERDSVIAKYGGIDNWIKYQDNGQIKNSINFIQNKKKTLFNKNRFEKRIIKTKKYLDETIIDIVKNNKNTEFIFVVPPYFRAWYTVNYRYNVSEFEIHKVTLQYLAKKSSIHNNMKVFAFGNQDFLDEISNYKDLGHYNYTFNSMMLTEIQKNNSLITEINIDNYLNVITKKVEKFNLDKLRKIFKNNQ